MKERPILFSGPMVNAILEGRKTQTRRIVKPQPEGSAKTKEEDRIYRWPDSKTGWEMSNISIVGALDFYTYKDVRSHGIEGDKLWVRESHYLYGRWHKNGTTKTGKQKLRFAYVQSLGVKFPDDPPEVICKKKTESGWFKRSSLFMPFWACRTKLEITKVRVERLQDISDSDCIAEGISDEAMDECEHYQIAGSPLRGGSVERCAYSTLWESINGPGSWEKNPFVWVIEFKRI